MKVIVVRVVVIRGQHEMEQPGADELALQDLEDRPTLREWLADAIDVVAEALLVIAIDAHRADVGSAERVDIDREAEAVLRRSVRAAHVAARVRRRELRLLDALGTQIAAR